MDKIYLTGFMGSGKTAYGKQLAEQSGWYFLDTDQWLSQKFGKSIAGIFELYGEYKFRLWENKLLHATAILKNAIIATGGGMLAVKENMSFAKTQGRVVWLHTPLENILSIPNIQKKRPLLQLSKSELKNIYKQRGSIYAKSYIVLQNRERPEFKSLYRTLTKAKKD